MREGTKEGGREGVEAQPRQSTCAQSRARMHARTRPHTLGRSEGEGKRAKEGSVNKSKRGKTDRQTKILKVGWVKSSFAVNLVSESSLVISGSRSIAPSRSTGQSLLGSRPQIPLQSTTLLRYFHHMTQIAS